MPIYEYFCEKCQHEFEELVFGDDIPSCPKCCAQNAQKLMSRPCLHAGQGEQATSTNTSTSSKCSGCSGGNCANC